MRGPSPSLPPGQGLCPPGPNPGGPRGCRRSWVTEPGMACTGVQRAGWPSPVQPEPGQACSVGATRFLAASQVEPVGALVGGLSLSPASKLQLQGRLPQRVQANTQPPAQAPAPQLWPPLSYLTAQPRAPAPAPRGPGDSVWSPGRTPGHRDPPTQTCSHLGPCVGSHARAPQVSEEAKLPTGTELWLQEARAGSPAPGHPSPLGS